MELQSPRFNRVDGLLVVLFIATLILTDKQEPLSAPPSWWESIAAYLSFGLLALIIARLYLLTLTFSTVLRLAFAAVAVLSVMATINAAFVIRLAIDEREEESWLTSLYTSEISVSNTMGFESPESEPFAWINQSKTKVSLTLVPKNSARTTENSSSRMYQLKVFKPPCMSSDLKLKIENLKYGTNEFLEVSGMQNNPTLALVKMKDNTLLIDISTINFESGCSVSGDPRDFYFGIYDPRYAPIFRIAN